jgi:hypothetical protein
VLDPANTASGVWADSAYRSAEIEAALAARGLTSHIHRRDNRNKPLTKRQETAPKAKARPPTYRKSAAADAANRSRPMHHAEITILRGALL